MHIRQVRSQHFRGHLLSADNSSCLWGDVLQNIVHFLPDLFLRLLALVTSNVGRSTNGSKVSWISWKGQAHARYLRENRAVAKILSVGLKVIIFTTIDDGSSANLGSSCQEALDNSENERVLVS